MSSSSPRPARENLLSWYSTYGNVADVTAPGGSRFQTPTFDPNRGRVLSTYSSTASDLAVEAALGRLVQDADGNYYAWLNGTSMAAPHVAGVVGADPSRPPGDAARCGRGAAAQHGDRTCRARPALDPGVEFFGAPVQFCKGGSGSNNFYGKGLVNALAAASG